MWFKKSKSIPPPEGEKPITYSTTELQVGDTCVCLDDRPHDHVYQKLLIKNEAYIVREVSIRNNSKYGGPFIRLKGIVPIYDAAWGCTRFQKIPKQSKIIERLIEEPICVDTKKEFVDAKKLWKVK